MMAFAPKTVIFNDGRTLSGYDRVENASLCHCCSELMQTSGNMKWTMEAFLFAVVGTFGATYAAVKEGNDFFLQQIDSNTGKLNNEVISCTYLICLHTSCRLFFQTTGLGLYFGIHSSMDKEDCT